MLLTNWNDIFRMSSYWANLDRIKFWPLNSPGNGSPKQAKFLVDSLNGGDVHQSHKI